MYIHTGSDTRVFMCMFVFIEVAGLGRLPFVYEDLEEMGGWFVVGLSLTHAGS